MLEADYFELKTLKSLNARARASSAGTRAAPGLDLKVVAGGSSADRVLREPTVALTQVEPEALAGLLDDLDELHHNEFFADAELLLVEDPCREARHALSGQRRRLLVHLADLPEDLFREVAR